MINSEHNTTANIPRGPMKIDDLELGDEVEIQVRTELLDSNVYSYVLKGTVYGHSGARLVCGHNLRSSIMERAKILSHDRPWHEPEGWQEWDGLKIGDVRWVRVAAGWWRMISGYEAETLVEMLSIMNGEPVTRLWLTTQEPDHA